MTENLAKAIVSEGIESFTAFGRGEKSETAGSFKTENKYGLLYHVFLTRFFDLHGFGSVAASKKLIGKIRGVNPDLVHLHNIHGYYLNIRILFQYLREAGKPVVWTFHDCWPFTGHCSHFDYVNCSKWQTECHHCPNKKGYPASWLIDNSRNNFKRKRELFTSLPEMILVSPSEWLAGHLQQSFLKNFDIRVINNGVDIEKFKPVSSEAIRGKYGINNRYILGAASTWTEKKGLGDFIKLRNLLSRETDIVLVGLSRTQVKSMPEGIIGIERTESTEELAALYSGAEAFVNPTYVDNFPAVNLEALACGTPVITYFTGGSAESIDDNTGMAVEKGNISELAASINKVLDKKILLNRDLCRKRAVTKYSVDRMAESYLNLYKELLSARPVN